MLASHGKRRRTDPGFVGRQHLIDFDVEPAPLQVAQVHPQHDVGPVGGVDSTGPGVDAEDRGTVVVLPEEQALAFEVGEIRTHGAEFRGDVGGSRRVRLLLGEFE